MLVSAVPRTWSVARLAKFFGAMSSILFCWRSYSRRIISRSCGSVSAMSAPKNVLAFAGCPTVDASIFTQPLGTVSRTLADRFGTERLDQDWSGGIALTNHVCRALDQKIYATDRWPTA